MFIKGLKSIIVVVAYGLIPFFVLLGGLMLVGSSPVAVALILISALLFIIAFFLMIMAINNMVANDSLKKAFNIHEIKDNIANLGWGKYIGIVLFTIIVYMIIMVAVSVILSFITMLFSVTISNQALVISYVIAIIEGLFVDSYGALFYNRVCGSIYRESIK
jgi:hypothetical protein